MTLLTHRELDGFDLGWFAATVTSYSFILLFFQYFRLIKMIFSKNRSINYITIFMYIIIILGIIAGVISMGATVLDNNVYTMAVRVQYENF